MGRAWRRGFWRLQVEVQDRSLGLDRSPQQAKSLMAASKWKAPNRDFYQNPSVRTSQRGGSAVH
ncbi:hypothetical protein [Levilactobacillus parabrevis]|uniref:hypothetical protein n=1 Tax=Levilactobacillus parabrevis TaxID=357278 RepID=UPI0021A7731C|nr:hypothetical protein [Levilactobacillus parabrevis]